MSVQYVRTFESNEELSEWLSSISGEKEKPAKKKASVGDLLGSKGKVADEEEIDQEFLMSKIEKLADEEENIEKIQKLLKKHGATKGLGTMPKENYDDFWKELKKLF